MLAGKKSADSQLAGNFPTNVAGKWNFSYHPAGSAEQILFSQQQKKIVKKALKSIYLSFYGLFVTFCENVSLGAPGVTVDLIRRSWVRFPPRSKDFFFTSFGSLSPFTWANAQWLVIHVSISTLIFTSELILCSTIYEQRNKFVFPDICAVELNWRI